MKFTTSAVLLATTLVLLLDSASSEASTSSSYYTPIRISYQELQNGNAEDVLSQALQQVGMISITNIFAPQHKLKTFHLLPKCMEASLSSSSSSIMEHTYEDGTLRRTIATHSVGTTDNSELPDELAYNNNLDCEEFRQVSQTFREKVGNVMDVFATELSIVLNLDASKTVLLPKEEDDNDSSMQHHYSLKSIFDQGDHLEHFHCYYYNSNAADDSDKKKETIEWHTDQGLVLAFTPGMVNGEPTDGFYVQLADGSTKMVQFDETDDLVFLLGDGVNQYVNGALLEQESPPLRALPHAFRMPTTFSSSSAENPRSWYGRMVLPPPNAKHPLHPEMTFGEIREGMIVNNDNANAIGCSQNLVARELQATTCEVGVASYCWHRCMNHTDYNVSETICADQNKTLACMNDDGYLWPYIHDPQFALGCAEKDAVNWTDSVDETNSIDDVNSTNAPTAGPADSSTNALFFGTSILLGTIATLFSL